MILVLHLCLVASACAWALYRPDRAWLSMIVIGVIQDPVRKLTPGTPVYISFSVAALQLVILFASRRRIVSGIREMSDRFPALHTAGVAVLITLALAALQGLATFGLAAWQAPLLSLVTYLLPLVLAVFGFTWPKTEEDVYTFFRVYAVVTSVALIGTVLEYRRIDFPGLGTVAFQGEWIRHLPGIQIRMLSGFYRGPDIMATHAAMLTCVAAAMAVRHGFHARSVIWASTAAWGFLNCMLAGRRKAIYFVIVFCAAFLWRSLKRMRTQQIFALFAILAVLLLIVRQLAQGDETRVYTVGARATQSELAARIEGGLFATFQQFGLMGAGLGAATQGTHHVVNRQVGWQEGGLGKLAIELGLPGMIAAMAFALMFARLTLRLTWIGDVPGCSNFVRVTLFAFVAAHIANFTASAQAYSDAVLGPMAAFLAGCLLATASLDERTAPQAVPRQVTALAMTSRPAGAP